MPEAAPAVVPGDIHTETYGEGLRLDLDLSPADQGTLIHRCFEVLGQRPDLAPHLPDITGYPLDPATIDRIAKAVADFEQWLATRFPGATIHRELPITALNEAGSVVSGVVDLMVEADDRPWIIDHKTQIVVDAEGAFESFRSQLTAYSDVIAKSRRDLAVPSIGINWISNGQVSFVEGRIPTSLRATEGSAAISR
jgi:ATP-dependent exoDNAse (exonuclease V) beta subunit